MTKNKIKLCFIITGLSTGGAEHMLYKLLKYIDKNLFYSSVICLTNGGDFKKKIEEIGVTVYCIGMKRGIPSPKKIYYLTKLLKEIDPDIVHTWMYHADLLGGLISRAMGIKKVIWSIRQSNFITTKISKISLAVLYSCFFLGNYVPLRIISCSKRAKMIHVGYGYDENKICVIPNGFELEKFVPNAGARQKIQTELGIDSKDFLVGFVARYDPQKNHFGFIRSASKVLEEIKNAKFLLVGEGVNDSNEALVRAIEGLGISNAVYLLGKRDDIVDLMSSFDLHVLPSAYGEAFPNTVGEAMACAAPCVVTDVGDCAEIVSNTGIVVAPNQDELLAKAMIEVLRLTNVERLKIGISARQRIIENYEIKKVVKSYENLYVEVFSASH